MDENLFDRLLIQAEVKINNIRIYVIPKLRAEIERIEKYADEIETDVKGARDGDETAMISLVRHAFPKQRGEN